ncbi:MAG: cation transporter [Phycisphaera sp.]|nr:cation transporter [Phycisphaera sp.]
MKRALVLGVTLLSVWLLWSGHYVPLIISFGVLSCAFIVLLVRHMGILDEELMPMHLAVRPLRYAPWLFWQIILANIDVAKRILNPKLPISPTIKEVYASQVTELGEVIYANSITLTPGTISIRIQNSKILVHAIAKEGIEDLKGGEMDRRCCWVEGSIDSPDAEPRGDAGNEGSAA